MAVVSNILTPSVVTKIVSRIMTPGSALQQYFGMGIGGPKVGQVEGRAYAYDIFDSVRDIAAFRSPNTGPAVRAVNPVGRAPMTFPRSYEKLHCDYELLNNIRQLGQNAGTRDRMGMVYLEKQAAYLKQPAVNAREFLIAALLTAGQANFQIVGDNWIPVLTAAAQGYNISWQIPSGNLPGFTGAWQANLNPLAAGNIIAAAWSTLSTDIGSQLDAINQAFQQLVGAPLSLIVTDSLVWGKYVVQNTVLQAEGGSVNSVFLDYEMTQMKNADGKPIGVFQATIRARPWVKWLIVDTGLNFNGAYARFWPGNLCTFMCDPDLIQLTMQEGSEVIKESPAAKAEVAYGFKSWMREWDEPARIEIHALQNCVPELPVPKGVMIGRVA